MIPKIVYNEDLLLRLSKELGLNIEFSNTTSYEYITFVRNTLMVVGSGSFYLNYSFLVEEKQFKEIVNLLNTISGATVFELYYNDYFIDTFNSESMKSILALVEKGQLDYSSLSVKTNRSGYYYSVSENGELIWNLNNKIVDIKELN